MIPKQAIEKAIEGGWMDENFRLPMDATGSGRFFVLLDRWHGRHDFNYVETALDPTFWQALGKSLGWSEKNVWSGNAEWWFWATRFYNLYLLGGDTEMFWQEVLANHQ